MAMSQVFLFLFSAMAHNRSLIILSHADMFPFLQFADQDSMIVFFLFPLLLDFFSTLILASPLDRPSPYRCAGLFIQAFYPGNATQQSPACGLFARTSFVRLSGFLPIGGLGEFLLVSLLAVDLPSWPPRSALLFSPKGSHPLRHTSALTNAAPSFSCPVDWRGEIRIHFLPPLEASRFPTFFGVRSVFWFFHHRLGLARMASAPTQAGLRRHGWAMDGDFHFFKVT